MRPGSFPEAIRRLCLWRAMSMRSRGKEQKQKPGFSNCWNQRDSVTFHHTASRWYLRAWVRLKARCNGWSRRLRIATCTWCFSSITNGTDCDRMTSSAKYYHASGSPYLTEELAKQRCCSVITLWAWGYDMVLRVHPGENNSSDVSIEIAPHATDA